MKFLLALLSVLGSALVTMMVVDNGAVPWLLGGIGSALAVMLLVSASQDRDGMN